VQSVFELNLGKEHLRLIEQAVAVPSAATHAVGDACRQAGMVVSIGVNERDGGTLYNTQLLFDADGTLIQRRRKITPTSPTFMSAARIPWCLLWRRAKSWKVETSCSTASVDDRSGGLKKTAGLCA
jgi:predicted amidohydrolase